MDVIGEMQGELGVSHAYTWGFSAGAGEAYTQGYLGADFCWEQGAWRVQHIVGAGVHAEVGQVRTEGESSSVEQDTQKLGEKGLEITPAGLPLALSPLQ